VCVHIIYVIVSRRACVSARVCACARECVCVCVWLGGFIDRGQATRVLLALLPVGEGDGWVDEAW